MGEEAFEETRFVTEDGTVVLRSVYGSPEIYIGLSSTPETEEDPDVVVCIGPDVQKRLIEAIRWLSTVDDHD